MTKIVLPDVDPISLGAIRFLVAAVLMAVVCGVLAQRLRAPWRVHRNVALAGLVGITVYFALENFGVLYASATDAVLIVASYPVLTMIGEALCRGRRPTLVNVAGALIAFLGVVLVVLERAPGGATQRPVGIVLLVLGGVAWAAYNVMSSAPDGPSGTAADRLGPVGTTCMVNLWGGLGFCALAVLLPHHRYVSLTPRAVWLIVYLAVACSALAFLLYTFGLEQLRPSQAVAILNLVPVFGVLGAVVVAGETLTALRVAGAVVVMVGVALSSSGLRIDAVDLLAEAGTEGV